ncbi:MAG: CYTH domain-containing protein [Clostridia bacterium]|nr:CYTH domain-containing protein [Clostridia bacterium]
METEIKLAIDSKEKLFEIIDADWFKEYSMDKKPRSVAMLINSYFDTPDFKLRVNHCTVRSRLYSIDGEKKYEHTVKLGSNADNGLYQRYEWNVDADSEKFDLEHFIYSVEHVADSSDPVEILKDHFNNIDVDSLTKICSTEVERSTYLFGYGDSIMEACFDIGKAIADGKSTPICELEMELISGDVNDLKELSDFIVSKSDLRPSNESKFKKCLLLMGFED